MGSESSKQQSGDRERNYPRQASGYPHHTVTSDYQQQNYNATPIVSQENFNRQNSHPQRMPDESMANYNARLSSGARHYSHQTVDNLNQTGVAHMTSPRLPASYEQINVPTRTQPLYNAATVPLPALTSPVASATTVSTEKFPIPSHQSQVSTKSSESESKNSSKVIYDPSDDLDFWLQQPAAQKSPQESLEEVKTAENPSEEANTSDSEENIKNLKRDPKYLQFNKQVNKNKSPSDIRACLVNNKHLSDIVFLVQGTEIPAHKAMVITSSYLFYETFQLKGEVGMKIETVGLETFLKIMNYCYTSKLVVTEDNVQELMMAADKLQIRQIVNICHGFISGKMNPSTVFEIFEKALDENSEVFQKKCLDFIAKHEDACLASEGFFKMKLEALMKVIEVCKSKGVIEKWHDGPRAVTSGGEKMSDPGVKKTVEAKSKQQQKKPQNKENLQNKQKQQAPKPNQGAQKKVQQQKPVKGSNPNPQTVSNPQAPFAGQPLQNHGIGAPIYGSMPQNFRAPMMMGPQVYGYQHPQIFGANPMIPGNFVSQVGFPIAQNYVGQSLVPQNFGAQPMNPPKVQQKGAKGPAKAGGAPAPKPANAKPKNAEELITYDDEDDDCASIISHDDEAKTKATVIGKRHLASTEFSRIDLYCKKSLMINDIVFSCDLAKSSKEFRLVVAVLAGEEWKDIHNRMIKITKPNQKMNFIRLNRNPLKINAGQKFSIRIKFSENSERFNINTDSLSKNHLVDLNRAGSTKKYFNCISSVVVTEASP